MQTCAAALLFVNVVSSNSCFVASSHMTFCCCCRRRYCCLDDQRRAQAQAVFRTQREREAEAPPKPIHANLCISTTARRAPTDRQEHSQLCKHTKIIIETVARASLRHLFLLLVVCLCDDAPSPRRLRDAHTHIETRARAG